MGNLASMGYGASADAVSGENSAANHSASEYVQRLPPDELRKYTEGFRRICRAEVPSPANTSTNNSGKLPPAGRSSSASALPPTPEAAAKRRASDNSSRAAVVDAGSASTVLITGAALTKKVFRQKVLSAFPLIPTSLSDRLFVVLDTDRTGELSCENVLSGIARLKYGTYDEQVRLLFNIYDLDSAGLVSRDVMDRFMDVVYGRRRARSASTIAFLDRIFDSRSSLTLDEFKGVIRECDANGDALLLRWLSILADTIGVDDDPQILALERSYNPAVIRQRIADATLFSVSEVTALERQFHKLFDTKGGTSTRITHEQFIRVLSQRSFPTKLLERVCRTTTALDGLMLFDEFCRFVSNFCRGTTASRYTHLFQIFKRVAASADAGDPTAEIVNDTAAEEDDDTIAWSAIDELVELGSACATTEAERAQIESEQSRLTQLKTESASATGLTEPQFLSWAADATAVHQLLHQLAFAACILFGVTPESPQLERRIVEWHWTQATVSFSVGETWNLVGASWWHQWCHYAGMHPQNGTPLGTLPLPVIPDDARVQVARVESQRPERTTDAATSSAGNNDNNDANARPRPGPIANWGLLNRSGSRRLKDKLMFARDFYMIPSAAYAVLVLWYSGGPDLSRSIVEGPPGCLQIELFPLILRVARVDPSNGGVIMSGVEVLLSALSTPASLLEATCKALLLTKSLPKARLWYFDERQPEHKIRVRTDRPTVLKKLTQECVFLLEVQDDDGSWPLSQSSDTISGASPANKTRPSVATSVGNAGDDDDRDGDDDGSEYTSSDSDSDDDNAASHATRQRRKRPRDQRMLSRTSDICSRGNLESLTSVYKSGKSDAATTTSTTDKSAKGVQPSETLAAATTVKKRFSKDAFTGHGLVGLDNLGNTCYMSSALQCLSHTRLLVEYFKNEAYLRDINLRNRDGTNGKLAVAFGELLRVLWTSEKKRFAPTEFKRVLAKFNPQFTGSDQHDAQELLACLLSSLSEDLNRIMTKPYTEQPDSDGRSDAIVATEWWQNHLQRECSVIVALFTGQYKSLLECSVCHYESARFEPFTFLQLSLPESSFRSLVLTIIFNSGRVPMKYSVRVKHSATIQDVKHAIAQFLYALEHSSSSNNAVSVSVQDVEAQLAIARVSVLHIIDTLLDGRTPLTQVHEKDQLAVFQLDAPRREPPSAASTKSAAAVPHASAVHTNGVVAHAEGNGHVETSHDSESNKTSDAVEQSPANTVARTDDDDSTETDDATASDELLPVGTSVFVRADKVKEFASARVIGSSAKSGTVDVVFPSGARRYFVAQSKVVARKSPDAYVYLVHRRVERSTSCFTNAHITRLFGAPLVLRVSLRTTTTFDLYVMVWKRLRRIFNWQAPPSDTDVDTVDGDADAQRSTTAHLHANASTLALGEHLPVTKFGFCLRMVTSQGSGCSRCEWLDGCLGCLIRPSPHERIGLSAEETIAIDWDIRTLKEEYDPIQASKIDVDDSVQQHKREDNMPLSIERCMDMFTAKERIHEAYCGRCKTHRPATKTMDLWRLPPLLVIQLKRFCYTQVSRRKLHHHVDFPLRGLALEAFVAKQRTPKRMQESGLQYWQFLGGKLQHKDTDTSSTGKNADGSVNGDDKSKTLSSESKSPAQRVATPLLDAPATAAVRGADGFLYDLYAVVNHVGALGAGHYFAYVLSEQDGKWKCFNDHQCKDIDEKEVVSSTAYILFYRRRDTHNVPIETLFPPMAVKAPATNGDAQAGDDASASDQAQVEQLLEQSKLASAGGSSCVVS